MQEHISSISVKLVPLGGAMSDRPSMSDLWWRHRIKLSPLASVLAIPRRDIVDLFRGRPVKRCYAERVLRHLSILLSKEYTCETVKVHLIEDVPGTSSNQSEVARLMAKIQEEYDAGQQAMKGLALGTAQHRFITTRMENMQRGLEELHEVGGEEVALQFITRLGELDTLTLDQR